jgi:hypothetical protein
MIDHKVLLVVNLASMTLRPSSKPGSSKDLVRSTPALLTTTSILPWFDDLPYHILLPESRPPAVTSPIISFHLSSRLHPSPEGRLKEEGTFSYQAPLDFPSFLRVNTNIGDARTTKKLYLSRKIVRLP